MNKALLLTGALLALVGSAAGGPPREPSRSRPPAQHPQQQQWEAYEDLRPDELLSLAANTGVLRAAQEQQKQQKEEVLASAAAAAAAPGAAAAAATASALTFSARSASSPTGLAAAAVAGGEPRAAFLRPRQLRRRLETAALACLPFGALQWHARHLPFGTDLFLAERVCLELAARRGGVVFPAVPLGTASVLEESELGSVGLRGADGSKPSAPVWGSDFPGFDVRSAYVKEEVFAMAAREALHAARRVGARLAVMVVADHSVRTRSILQRIAAEVTTSKVITARVLQLSDVAAPAEVRGTEGHAASGETSMVLALDANLVNLTELPRPPRPLLYAHTGIVDAQGLAGAGASQEWTVSEQADPRNTASVAAGEQWIKACGEAADALVVDAARSQQPRQQ